MKSAILFLEWAMRITIAYLFLQTLQFKFTAHPESVFLFNKLGLEPHGRIITGVLELVAAILLLINPTKIYGIIASFSIIVGALLSHFFVLGIKVDGHSPLLFIYAVVIFILSIILAYKYRGEIIQLISKIVKRT
jgi:hypothetical protein